MLGVYRCESDGIGRRIVSEKIPEHSQDMGLEVGSTSEEGMSDHDWASASLRQKARTLLNKMIRMMLGIFLQNIYRYRKNEHLQGEITIRNKEHRAIYLEARAWDFIDLEISLPEKSQPYFFHQCRCLIISHIDIPRIFGRQYLSVSGIIELISGKTWLFRGVIHVTLDKCYLTSALVFQVKIA